MDVRLVELNIKCWNSRMIDREVEWSQDVCGSMKFAAGGATVSTTCLVLSGSCRRCFFIISIASIKPSKRKRGVL